jgi:molybdenum cofactor cytidylyltransferase
MRATVSILILAAGSSSRMGKIKQLLPWQESTLLEHTIKIAKLSKACDVIVVLGSNARLIKETIKTTKVVLLENTKWKGGLATSVSCGIDYLLNDNKACDAVLILLADQALMDTEHINKIIDLYNSGESDLIGTRYEDKIGVPALFKHTYFPDLLKLYGDRGAQLFLQGLGDKVLGLDPGGKAYDVDTLEDYNRLLKLSDRKN